MADEENALQAAPEAPAEPAPATSPEPSRKPRSLAWVGYVLLLAMIALAGGGWFLLSELRSRQEGLGGQITTKEQQVLEAARQLNAAQSELAALHTQVATLQSAMSNDDTKFERLISEETTRLNERIDTTRTELGGTLQQIQRQLNKNRGDLLIADAEYLLGIANQKLHLIGDVKAVLAAMEAADQRLHDSGDPAVFKVREALAEEIDILKKLQAPDVVGISAKLLNLEKKVAKLPLFLPHAGTVEEHGHKETTADKTTDTTGKDIIDSTLDDIKDLVTVRRTDRPVTAVLLPEEAEGLRQILLLKLENTRVALLRADDQLYQDSLNSARDWLNANFDTHAEEVREMAGELNSLLTQPISVPFPDVSKSLALLRNIENLRIEAEEAALKSKATTPVPPSPPPPAAGSGSKLPPTDATQQPGARP